MQDKKNLFETFSDNRLVEIVKNSKQFGYDDNTRNIALEVLKARGIGEEDLQLTGNLTNYKFDHARDLFRSYNESSNIALVAYLLLLVINAVVIFHIMGMNEPGNWYSIASWLVALIFLAALIKSFSDHTNFYKALGKEAGTGAHFIFFVLGIPFYMFMYPFYKSRMKEEMQMMQ